MDATDLIFKLRNDGHSIEADGSYLDISPADNLSTELVQQLKNSKTDILCSLNREKELVRLVHLVSNFYGFSKEEHQEALETALSDQINALTCFTFFGEKGGSYMNLTEAIKRFKKEKD